MPASKACPSSTSSSTLSESATSARDRPSVSPDWPPASAPSPRAAIGALTVKTASGCSDDRFRLFCTGFFPAGFFRVAALVAAAPFLTAVLLAAILLAAVLFAAAGFLLDACFLAAASFFLRTVFLPRVSLALGREERFTADFFLGAVARARLVFFFTMTLILLPAGDSPDSVRVSPPFRTWTRGFHRGAAARVGCDDRPKLFPGFLSLPPD